VIFKLVSQLLNFLPLFLVISDVFFLFEKSLQLIQFIPVFSNCTFEELHFLQSGLVNNILRGKVGRLLPLFILEEFIRLVSSSYELNFFTSLNFFITFLLNFPA